MTERLGSHEVGRAAELLLAGGTVGIPTETVYGLGADAASDEAVAKIFWAKGRPAGHPLIVHLASTSQLPRWTTTTDGRVMKLADAFWPGPLTMIVPRTDQVSTLVVGDRPTVGLRVPDHPVAQAVLAAFAEAGGSGGVAAPSANRFGHVSPTTAEHVLADLDGRIDAVIDGGSARVGVESTILEMADGAPTLLRPGGVPVEALESVLGEAVVDGRAGASRAAGMMASHYSPTAAVRIVSSERVRAVLPRTAALIAPTSFGHDAEWVLSPDAAAYAEGLYRALRAVDDAGFGEVIVVPPEHGDLLDAVLDRLVKAAGPT